MTTTDPEDILKIMDRMAALELKVAEFYQTCAHNGEKDFWTEMQKDEVHHAENLRRMAVLFSANPELFEPNRSFQVAAIHTAIGGVQQVIEKVHANQLERTKILFIARDIEQSLLEVRYGDFLRSRDLGYQKLVRELQSETRTHKSRIEEKIQEAQNGLGH
jgi:hypothetical protein